MSHNQVFGQAGEAATAAYYRGHGYDIAARNWRAPRRYGANELDIVATLGSMVVFCEVKARSSGRFGEGAEAVNYDKQRRVRQAALAWLSQSDRQFLQLRFDVAMVDRRGGVRVLEACF